VARLHQRKAGVLSGADDEAGSKLAAGDNHDHELSRSRPAYCEADSAATDEGDDFQLVAVRDDGVSELRPLEDAAVPLDGDASSVEAELLEELLDRNPRREQVRLAVEADADFAGGGYFFSSFLFVAR
jgi:hypothetical protein